ncbi:hypothetical protein N7490_009123 [Penicillium lividum]|nr:hypothetical protein N7490_009123 [Penicillium lividum]
MIDEAVTSIILVQYEASPAEQYFRKLVYLMSNKMIKWDNVNGNAVYMQIKGFIRPTILESMFSLQSPTVEAFAEQMFPFAVEAGDAATVEFLLQKLRIDPNRLFGYQLPLELACRQRNLRLVRALLDAGADVNGAGVWASALEADCTSEDDEDLFRTLIRAGLAINPKYGKPPLCLAADKADTIAVSTLLDTGANVNPLHYNPLGYALRSTVSDDCIMIKVIQLLLEHGADVHVSIPNWDPSEYGSEFSYHEDEDLSIMEIAVCKGRSPEIIKLLIKHNVLISPTAVCHAFAYGDVELTRTLLDQKVGIPEYSGEISPGIANLILEYESSKSEKTFQFAVWTEDFDLVMSFLEAGVSLTLSLFEVLAKWVEASTIMMLLEKVPSLQKPECYVAAMKRAILEKDFLLLHDLQLSAMTFPKLSKGSSLSGIIQKTFDGAACENDLRLIKELNSEEFPFRCLTNDCIEGLLLQAVNHGSKDVIRYLLHNFPMDKVRDGPKLIVAAIRRSNADLLWYFIGAGALLNELTSHHLHSGIRSRTVLSEAVKTGSPVLVRSLIQAGADVNALAFCSDRTVLDLAISLSNLTIVDILLEAGADVNNPIAIELGSSALEQAIHKSDILLVQKLLSHGANIDNPVLVTSVFAPIRILLILLSTHRTRHMSVFHGQGCHALQLAIVRNDIDKVKILLDFGIQVNWISMPVPGFQQRHLPDNAQIEYGISALGIAIKSMGEISDSVVHLILERAGSVNFPAKVCPSTKAIYLAIEQSNARAVETLINFGANVNEASTWDLPRTPLQLAAEKGQSNVIKLLLNHKADINAPAFFKGGATALQLASIRGDIEILRVLLNAGGSVSASGAEIDGRTTIEGAAEHGRLDNLMLLVTWSANNNMGFDDAHYRKARKLARKNGHLTVCRILDSIIKN